ncbi:hypothetical protein J6590_021117 [Homalodisca vitripennis]|nr:hypothetical protein J6590_021117 [Homalodisca vitripennis]
MLPKQLLKSPCLLSLTFDCVYLLYPLDSGVTHGFSKQQNYLKILRAAPTVIRPCVYPITVFPRRHSVTRCCDRLGRSRSVTAGVGTYRADYRGADLVGLSDSDSRDPGSRVADRPDPLPDLRRPCLRHLRSSFRQVEDCSMRISK